MNILFIPLFLLAAAHAQDTDISIRMGQGLSKISKSGYYSLNFTKHITPEYSYRMDFGGYSDNQPGHRGSLFTGVLLGRHFGTKDGFNASIHVGTKFISQPDIVLSTPFQFTEEVNIGYGQASVGLSHTSNATIKKPNLGRDYIYFNYRLEF